ncbi:hypothetical protein KGF54_001500 [Candida jiufengensis]|uniref:uncharacterized protein n=1 Tax=Candida jiufengensis TaxID=497108 RepID=UPI002224E7D6|nr:uncharacterized protein KGF54_001500 [Candida jiufengensis]KAI5954939.1 hypothetical protein KGF54_001500 [Candida jiufengensis]
MKLNLATATLVLAALSQAAVMPAATVEYSLTTRELETVNNALANLQTFNRKRSIMSPQDLAKRESQIVTDILTIVKDTNLAPTVLEWFISDPTLSKIAIDVIVSAIKNGWINLGTLLKSLNDSGLAVSVIQDLINDCAFYAQIFKIVGEVLADLPNIIGNLLGLNQQQVTEGVNKAKREYLEAVQAAELAKREEPVQVYSRDTQEILTSLFESLKNSGLANQVVEALVVDDDFYTFGANLIEELFKQNAISLSELLSDLIDSGLIPSLIKAFLNIDTLKTIIVNALAAAFGNCKDTTTTSTFATTPTGSAAPTITTGTPDASITSLLSITTTGGPSKCKKKRRAY